MNLVAKAGGGFRVSDVPPAVACDESRRPVLLSLRMVQELITRYPSPDPGDMVAPETAFGLAPSSGASLDYSRADHTHGSPVLPNLGGDLSGPIQAAHIERLQGVPLVTGTPLIDGRVLTLAGGQWVPAALPPPPSPILVGDATGPASGNKVVGLQGQPLNPVTPGTDQVLRFVGGQWVPQTLLLSGDVQGAVGANRIFTLQGKTVDAPSPGNGQVLLFSGNKWVAGNLPSAPEGQFVGRGTKEPYEIVAAGEAHVQLINSVGTTTMQPAPGYGALTAFATSVATQDIRQAQIDLRAEVSKAAELKNYIVKLTPIWIADMKFGFRLFLLARVVVESDTRIRFSVLLLGDQQIHEGSFEFRFQVEVSRF